MCSHVITTVHTLLQLFTCYYNCSHAITTVHMLLQLFTRYYNCSHVITTVHMLLQLFTCYYNCSHVITTVHTLLQLFTRYYSCSLSQTSVVDRLQFHVISHNKIIQKSLFHTILPSSFLSSDSFIRVFFTPVLCILLAAVGNLHIFTSVDFMFVPCINDD